MAASDVNTLIVEPGGNACSYASRGLTTARILPLLGSITRTQPSRSPSAAVAERKRVASTSASFAPDGVGVRCGAGCSGRRPQPQIATQDRSKPVMSHRAAPGIYPRYTSLALKLGRIATDPGCTGPRRGLLSIAPNAPRMHRTPEGSPLDSTRRPPDTQDP